MTFDFDRAMVIGTIAFILAFAVYMALWMA
jgi:hypothetical protein